MPRDLSSSHNAGLSTESNAERNAKSREIKREFELMAGQGHQRSSIFVSNKGAHATSY